MYQADPFWWFRNSPKCANQPRGLISYNETPFAYFLNYLWFHGPKIVRTGGRFIIRHLDMIRQATSINNVETVTYTLQQINIIRVIITLKLPVPDIIVEWTRCHEWFGQGRRVYPFFVAVCWWWDATGCFPKQPVTPHRWVNLHCSLLQEPWL